jgi:hypothetical protein
MKVRGSYRVSAMTCLLYLTRFWKVFLTNPRRWVSLRYRKGVNNLFVDARRCPELSPVAPDASWPLAAGAQLRESRPPCSWAALLVSGQRSGKKSRLRSVI